MLRPRGCLCAVLGAVGLLNDRQAFGACFLALLCWLSAEAVCSASLCPSITEAVLQNSDEDEDEADEDAVPPQANDRWGTASQ